MGRSEGQAWRESPSNHRLPWGEAIPTTREPGVPLGCPIREAGSGIHLKARGPTGLEHVRALELLQDTGGTYERHHGHGARLTDPADRAHQLVRVQIAQHRVVEALALFERGALHGGAIPLHGRLPG